MNVKAIGLSTTLVALLTACAPESGQVVDSAYRPAWIQFIPGTPSTTRCTGNPPSCVTVPGMPPQFIPHPESWELELDNGKDRGWRAVDIQAYHLCSVGKHYPECAQVNR